VFQREVAGARRELHLDQATGLPLRVLSSMGDSVSNAKEISYASLPGGVVVRRSERRESWHGKEGSITDVSFSNIRLEKRGTP
jgi:hypothetical protein